MAAVHNVSGSFQYWAGQDDPQFTEIQDIISGSHSEVGTYPSEVKDMRAQPNGFNINDHGFQILHHDCDIPIPTNVNFGSEDETVRTQYWPELCSVIRSQLGVRSAVVFESTIRESGARTDVLAGVDRTYGVAAKKTENRPFFVVHNDLNPAGARQNLRAVLPSFFHDLGYADALPQCDQETFATLRNDVLAAEDRSIREKGCHDCNDWDGSNYKGPRWATFSLWRPIEVVKRDPLALMDASSMFTAPSTYTEKEQAYLSINIPHRGRKGFGPYEGRNIMPRPPTEDKKHRWWWLSEHQPHEIFAIKLFDSEAWVEGSRVMPCSAHATFELAGEDLPPRKSIETRVIVIW